MMLPEEIANERKRNAARAKRYKKPMCNQLNIEGIMQFLQDAGEEISEIAYATQNDDVLLKALDGDTDEAFEYRAAFSDLEVDMERMYDDMQEYIGDYEDSISRIFDLFFVGIGGDGGQMLGYDAYEEDYFGLGEFEEGLAVTEAGRKLERLTKRQIIDAAGRCFRVAVNYIGLRNRYEDLRAALDVLRGENHGLIEVIKHIEALYDDAMQSQGFGKRGAEFDRLLGVLPDECWVR